MGLKNRRRSRSNGNDRSSNKRRMANDAHAICNRSLWMESLERRELLAITVDVPFDERDFVIASGDVSLRDAILEAPAGETIDFDPTLDGVTIELLPALGEILFSKSLIIDASMLPNGITVDANGGGDGVVGDGDGFRIFNIDDITNGSSPPEVTLIGLTLQGGDTNASGGAILSEAILTIRDSKIKNNQGQNGGAINQKIAGIGHFEGTVLTIDNTTIDSNSAFTNGGGIFATLAGGSTLKIENGSVLQNNEAGINTGSSVGGGLRVSTGVINGSAINKILISNSDFLGNSADTSGGAIHHTATAAAQLSISANSKFSANKVTFGDGGAIFSEFNSGDYRAFPDAGVTIEDSELTGNFAINEALQDPFSGSDGGAAFIKLGANHSDARGLNFELSNSDVVGNKADNRGGGIYLLSGEGASSNISASTISGNEAGMRLFGNSGELPNAGGGLYAYLFSESDLNGAGQSTLTITKSTFSDNTAGIRGGGIAICAKNDGTGDYISEVNIINSTISGNTAGQTTAPIQEHGRGGGLYAAVFDDSFETHERLRVVLSHSTVYENKAGLSTSMTDHGGGIFATVPAESTSYIDFQLKNSIVSGNEYHNGDANNFWGSINASETEYNLISYSSTASPPDNRFVHHTSHSVILFTALGSGNLDNGGSNNPGLGELELNRGRTETHLPLAGSDAIDMGDPSITGVGETDQRFLTRVSNGRVDIGSVEVQEDSALPTIKDIILDRVSGDAWFEGAEESLVERVDRREQFRSIYKEKADTIVIVFSEHVVQQTGAELDGTELTLRYTEQEVYSQSEISVLDSNDLAIFDYEPSTFTATWTFSNPLPNGKYAIHLDTSDIYAANMTDRIDAEWSNDDNGANLINTPDYFLDDSQTTEIFLPNDGASNSATSEFRFHFAYYQGDYDGDQDVDGRDFLRAQYGDLNLSTDGNGNNAADLGDITVYENNAGTLPHLRVEFGVDVNDDEIVDAKDLGRILDNYPILVNALPHQGDMDGDQDVDGTDILIWQDRYLEFVNSRSAWYEPSNVSAFTFTPPANIPGVAPFIYNVIFGKHASMETPYEFATLFGKGEQLRSVPLSGVDKITLQFSEYVAQSPLNANSLEVINLDGNSPGTAIAFSYSGTFTGGAQTATWRFNAPLEDGRYLIRLLDPVKDWEDEILDGEMSNPWTLSNTGNPIASSGDGEQGGSFRFRATILANDTDHDNIDGSTDYTEWPSIEPGMILVSTTTDEVDTDYSQGDMSLREAIIQANLASEPTTIVLPTGRYSLTRTGTEAGDASYNDLDVTGELTILGDGAGLSIIDSTSLSGSHARALHLDTATAELRLDQLTIANGSGAVSGQGVYVTSGEKLEIYDSAIVNHEGWAGGSGVAVADAEVIIRRSVFTNNDNTSPTALGSGLTVYATSSGSASLTVGQSVFAHNVQGTGTEYSVWANASVTKTNEGYNLYDDAAGGFFDTTSGTGDYLGTPDYVVTSVADTFDHTNDLEALSLREAIDLANTNAGAEEIWVPAWHFELTLDRGSNVYDTDISYGDLDITDDLTIRGVDSASGSATSIAWKSGIVDDIFDLLGDADNDGQASQSVGGSDYSIWQQQNSSGSQDSSNWGVYSADFDDDGDVDNDDLAIWSSYNGNTLDIEDILV